LIPPLLRRLALALLLALALVAGASAGSFEVATYADLCKVGTGVDGWTLDADYIQTADIQCPAGVSFTPIGTTGDPFIGSYDGQGHVIRDLFIDMPDGWDVGLFGEVEDGAVITNVTLEEFSITAWGDVGGLVGLLDNEGVIIENCTVSGTISGWEDIGGLIGYAKSATITDCHADVEILGEMMCKVGGLIGETYNCNVTSCSAQGDIAYADESGGGLIGYSSGSTITDCHAHGDVKIDPDARYHDGPNGGLVGELDTSSAFNCSATGNVIGGEWGIGGLVGYGHQATVARCYASGNVSGYNHVGGLIGHGYQATVARCYASGNVSGFSRKVSGYEHVGGLIGYYDPGGEYSIEDCYATGNVVSSGSDAGYGSAGGLIGSWDQYCLTQDGHIRNVYSTGSVSAPNLPAEAVGGLIGEIECGTGVVALNAYWDTETSGQATSAGGAVGKTTAEMQALATFSGWSIATPATYTDEVWYLVPGEDYPRLAWEGLPATPPVAAFSAAPTTGTAPLTVQFTDASTNAPTAWSWIFGDGGTSDQQHPAHTYNEPGTYTVALTVTNPGGSDTLTRAGYITVSAPVLPPVAAFSAAPTTGTAPLTVKFTDASTNAPTARSWNFGDGRTSIAQSPSHTYSTAGTYTVALTVTNAGGSDTETKTGYITVSAPPPTAPPTAANSPAFPYSQQRKETLSFLLMCWGALAFVGVFCVVIFLLMNGAQRGSGGI